MNLHQHGGEVQGQGALFIPGVNQNTLAPEAFHSATEDKRLFLHD
jgi:hypothetical protein